MEQAPPALNEIHKRTTQESGKKKMNSPQKQLTGIIFNIQRYCLHDGPGIRTTVFFKGCPMHCAWCENPESIQAQAQLGFYSRLCIGCGNCQKICPSEAVDLVKDQRIDWAKCNNCGACVKTCPASALQMIGEVLSVEEVLKRVLRDRKFFDRSGGGLTISGGESTLQYDYLIALLAAFKNEGVHVVLETNGLLPWRKFEPLTHLVSIFYFDLKGMDPVLHQKHTGVSNEQILENARKLVAEQSNIVFRLPLIPTMNTTPVAIKQLAMFLDELEAIEIHLLPYHRLGTDKLGGIYTKQRLLSIPAMHVDEANKLKEIFEKPGRKVLIGGV